MPTIWWLLLTSVVPGLGWYLSVSCPDTTKCQRALLSGSDVLLQCNIPGAHWSYVKQSGGDWHINLSSVPNVETTPEGNLAIRKAMPTQTGLYHCWSKEGILAAWHEVDFQDASTLRVTHAGLGQKPLQSERLPQGGKELVFTQWEPWQGCDRCGRRGERKRLGFCHVLDPLKGPTPCGLYFGDVTFFPSRLLPEMQVEACLEQCAPWDESSQEYVVFDSFRLMDESESAWLTCPLASVYRPVSWEANNTTLTWQDQLSGRVFSTFLDPSTGGQLLQVFRPAMYRCFVEQELVAKFNPRTGPETLGTQRREAQAQGQQPGKANSVLKGLKLTLLMGTALALVGLLLKVLHPAQGDKSDRVLLVK